VWIAQMQCLQNALAYFSTVTSCSCQMLKKFVPDN
jgi:hypothetical protein